MADDGRQADAGDERSAVGTLERIIYYNEDTFFCVGEFRPEKAKANVVVVGLMPGVQCGETLEVTGRWEKHAEHGLRFQVRTCKAMLPSSVAGIRKYLGGGLVPGIGKVYADRIVDEFGADTLRIIDQESARLREVPGIGPKRAREIKASWEEHRAFREVFLFLMPYGISTALARKIVAKYGVETVQLLRTDPYRMARELNGVGFKTADRIAINLGLPNESESRIRAGLEFALQTIEEDGHTASPREALPGVAAGLLGLEVAQVAPVVDAMVAARELVVAPGTAFVQLPATAQAEQRLADNLHLLRTRKSCLPLINVPKAVQWAQDQSSITFAPAQSEALATALTHKVSIVTGGPGTGKTTILRSLVAILKAKKVRLELAAPTGRAAQRLSEAAGHFAQTLHRLLRYDPAQGRFTANEDSPLRCDVMVVDEASMLDTQLASQVFRALPLGAHLVLVGDVDQLPSVGPGAVLGDLIASGLCPVARLNQVFRQKGHSGIVTAAHSMLEGASGPPFGVARGIDGLDPSRDFHFLMEPDAARCQELVVRLCREWLPAHTKFDPIRDVQVLGPMYRGTAGVGNLNLALQEALNPDGARVRIGPVEWRVGDKVMQVRNNYDKDLFNGDLGIVVDADPGRGVLTVRFPPSKVVELERQELSDLQLAYAATIHKSQGSEFPVVVMPLLKQHFMLLQRNLVYTGVTRARRCCIIVGDPAAYAMAMNNAEARQRTTALPARLRG